MKKTIKDYELKNKKVIIRVDFNVPIKNQQISDDTRIKEALKTINYAINKKAKVILMSHLGRIKDTSDRQKASLRVVAKRLEELLNKKVIFVDETRGEQLEKAIASLKGGQVLLMENTRFEDLNDKSESQNNEELGAYWASLGELFINDAFGTSHRAHASNVGIASHLPSGLGFLVEKELEVLTKNIKTPKRPFCVILGGAKVSDKIGVIKSLVEKADYILIGGAMANTFLLASNISVGSSLVENDFVSFCKEILDNNEEKIILPIDVSVASNINAQVAQNVFVNEVNDEEQILDIGPRTVELFKKYLEKSQTIIWNGPVGAFEYEPFKVGTNALCEVLKNIDAIKIVGGGDSASAVKNFGYDSFFTHISTGGGASLELLEGKILPGVDIIDEK